MEPFHTFNLDCYDPVLDHCWLPHDNDRVHAFLFNLSFVCFLNVFLFLY